MNNNPLIRNSSCNAHDTAVRVENEKWQACVGSASNSLGRTTRRTKPLTGIVFAVAAGTLIALLLSMQTSADLSFIIIWSVITAGVGYLMGYAMAGDRPITIPGAILSEREARHLTPSERDRLMRAYREGVLKEALAVFSDRVKNADRQTAQEIMGDADPEPQQQQGKAQQDD